MDARPTPRPVGVGLIALFLGGTALVALILPLGLLLTGASPRMAVPFLGSSRALDDLLLALLLGLVSAYLLQRKALFR
jgi:hypothetical protein